MPDGIDYHLKEIARKVALAQMGANRRAKEILQSILDEDLEKLREYLRR